jgi:phospholipid/cholesterol/gamma-HCH transport system substrate-binding protein
LKIPRELKVGFFFILAVAGFIWGLNFLKGKNIFSKERYFYAVYNDVNGLEKSNPVLINGMRIGQVNDMYFDPSMNGNVIIVMAVKNEFPIPKNSVSRIFSSDLMGSRAISIELGSSDELAISGDTLVSSMEATLKEEVNRQIQPLKRKAENLILSIDSMVVAVQGVFTRDIRDEILTSVQSIRMTFENLETTTSNIDTLVVEQSNRLASILYNLDMITMNLRDNSDEINNTIDNISTISDSLAMAHIPQTFQNLNRVVSDISEITQKINSGEGSIGMLLNNDQLYIELEKTTYELNQLLEDIRVNPKRYVKFSLF